MSGPPLPRETPPSGIGHFVIGVSPIGTVNQFDIWQTIISQYANSPTITAILESFFEAVDLTRAFDEFYDLVWNVDTAQGHGLDIWGRIVGIAAGRTLQIPAAGKYFGFQEATTASADPFNQSPFFSGGSVTQNFELSDGAFRLLILAKALANISDGSVKSINTILRTLFPGRGNAYVADNMDMTLTYTFAFGLSPAEFAIVSQSGVLPKPVGVLASVVAP